MDEKTRKLLAMVTIANRIGDTILYPVVHTDFYKNYDEEYKAMDNRSREVMATIEIEELLLPAVEDLLKVLKK